MKKTIAFPRNGSAARRNDELEKILYLHRKYS